MPLYSTLGGSPSPSSQPSSIAKHVHRVCTPCTRHGSTDGFVKPGLAAGFGGRTPPGSRRSAQSIRRPSSSCADIPVGGMRDSVVPRVGFEADWQGHASPCSVGPSSSVPTLPCLLSQQLSEPQWECRDEFGKIERRGDVEEGDVDRGLSGSTASSSGRNADGPIDPLSRAQKKYAVFSETLVIRAYAIALIAHNGQFRKNGDPVIVHCVEAAAVLADLGAPADVISAALLHDVLDDTALSEDDLRRVVPASVFGLVKSVSRISHISQLHRDKWHGEAQSEELLEQFRSMLLGLAEPRAVLIKLADRLHNMRTLDALPVQKQLRIADETLQLFAPLASRLGVWSLKSELEDLSFRYLHTEEFEALSEKLERSRGALALQDAIDDINDAVTRSRVKVLDLAGRPKNLYSIFQKIRQKGKQVEELFDICAVRIVVNSKQDCYTAYRALELCFGTEQGRFKDYIRNPKPNGYSSLHGVIRGPGGVPVEVQIRTPHMHFLAEFGMAAHWRYKEKAETMSQAEQQLIHYYRWVCNWELELMDKKFRASGSARRDAALQLFGAKLPKVAGMACPHSDCSFLGYVTRHHLPIQSEVSEACPVYVLVSGQAETEVRQGRAGGIAIRRLPPRCTVAQLLADPTGLLGRELLGGQELLVNNAPPTSMSQLLHPSDHIEVADAPDAPHRCPWLAACSRLLRGPTSAADCPSSAGSSLETTGSSCPHQQRGRVSVDLDEQRARLVRLLGFDIGDERDMEMALHS